MKNKIKFLFIIIIAIIQFSCIKEDPDMSTNPQAITGVWKVVNFSINDVDQTQMYNDSCGCKLMISNPTDRREDWMNLLINDTLKMGSNNKEEGQFKLKTSYTITFSFGNANNYISDSIYNISFGVGPLGTNRYSTWKILKLIYKSEWLLETTFENKKYSMKLMYLKEPEYGKYI